MSSNPKKEKKKKKKLEEDAPQEESDPNSTDTEKKKPEEKNEMVSVDENERKINELQLKMQYCIEKGQLEDGLIMARTIIELSKLGGNTLLVKEIEKSMISMQKQIKTSYKNVDIDEKITTLQKQKQEHDEKEQFEEAINLSEKLLMIAIVIGKKKMIQEEEHFIEEMNQKIKNRPSKVEIIDKIEKLRGIKREHTTKQEYREAIELSKEIIRFAGMAGVNEIIEEEEDSIKLIENILSKEQSVIENIEEYKKLRKDYDILVKHKAIKQAHLLMEEFYEKNIDNPQVLADPEIERDIREDKKQWVTFRVEKDKQDKEKLEQEGIALARKKIVKLEMEKVKLEEEKSRLRRELSNVKRKQEYSEIGIARAEIEKETSQIQIEKKKLDLEKKKLEEFREKWEHEKSELKQEKKEDVEIIAQLEREKAEIKEAREKLSVDITLFMEQKEDLKTKKLEFDEEVSKKEAELHQKASKLEEEREKLEWEKLKFHQEKEKFEDDKKKLSDDKKKFDEIKKKLSEL